MLTFLTPYLQLCWLAAWGIAQNLEGLGLFAPLNSPPTSVAGHAFFPLVLSANRGVAIILILMTFLLALVIMTSIRAGFYLSRKTGTTIILLWALPGLAALLGLETNLHQYGPDIFRFNAGFTGGVGPAIANLFLFLTAGWSILMLIGTRWKRDVFKNLYDHIWYALGLLAAVYFVVDTSLTYYQKDLKDAQESTEELLHVYADSAKQLKSRCLSDEAVKSQAPHLCEEAANLLYEINTEITSYRQVRSSVPFGDWQQVLEQPVIASEIARLNAWACPQGSRETLCLKYPPSVIGDIEAFTTGHAFPPNDYIDRLNKHRERIGRIEKQVANIEQGRNLRYFAFMLIAFLAGGKLANASRALRATDLVAPRSWMALVLKTALRLLQKVGMMTWGQMKKPYRFVYPITRRFKRKFSEEK